MKLLFASFLAPYGLRALAVIFIIGPAVLLTACTGETAEQEGRAENASADGTSKKKEVVPKPAPLRIRVVVPYAGNMPGFMNYRAPMGTPLTEFQQRVGGLLTTLGKNPSKQTTTTFVTTDAAGRLAPTTYAELADLVDGDTPGPYAPGLAVPPLLTDAAAAVEQDSNVVTILATDLTHNGGHPTTLASLPGAVTAALKNQRGAVAFSVYAEPSRFAGTYFPALRSAPKKGTVTSIPYYLWLIGTPTQISRVARLYLPNPPERQAHVGLTYPNVAVGALLTGLPAGSDLENSGEGAVWEEGKAVAVQDAAKTAEFSFGLNLDDLPSAWQKPEFLATALRVALPGGMVTLATKPVRRLTDTERANSRTLAPFTHAVRVKLTKLAPGTSAITLTLPAPELPTWPGQWTTAVDQPPGLTTYRLKQVLEGARLAHGEGALPPVFSVKLPLINQD